MMRLLIAIVALLASAAGSHAQQPRFPGMPDGVPPIILPGGIGGKIDCKMLIEMMGKAGMPPQMQAMLAMMGCPPNAAAPPSSTPTPRAPEPSARTLGDHACEMFLHDTAQPLIWLGPMPVMGARELPERCPISPAQRPLIAGLVQFGEGRLEQSIASMQAAVAQAPDQPSRLRALAELAKSQIAAARGNEARETAERALKTLQAADTRATDDERRSRATMRGELLIVLGLALQQTNDLPGAIARFQEADAVMRDRGVKPLAGFDDPQAGVTRPYLAAALIKAGRDAEARPLLQAMLQGRQQSLDLSGRARVSVEVPGMGTFGLPGNIGEKMDAWSMYSGDMLLSPFVCAALAKIDGAQSAERALETTEQCRGRVLASLLANRTFHAPERASMPSEKEIEAHARERKIDRNRALQEIIEQRSSNPRARAASRPATIDEMRRMAAERNATLVIYAIDHAPNLLPMRMPDRETGVTIWVVSPDGKVTSRQRNLDGLLGEGTLALSAAALRLRETMGVPGRGELRASTAASGGSADLRRFHQLLIEPIRDLLPAQEGSRLIIVPERTLFLVPFAALENANGEPLIARHAISVTPSLQTLALASLRKQPAAGNAAVIVGNPLMPSYTPRPGARPIEIPPLPGAEEEARAVAAILKASALTGAAATKSAVLTQAANARYVHLATHGFLDRLTDQAQSGVNPHVREFALFDETTGGGVKTPGMLALAASGADSGMLTADEIAQSSTTAELVVMSACDSGRGAINDDGVIGLSRAWMAAGAPSVMVTLWTIPDEATKDLMVAFYQQLAAGTRKAEALRLAILATRAKYPDPFNWAAFMLIGEPD